MPSLQGLALIVGEGDLDRRSTATRHGMLLLQGFYLTERTQRGEIPEFQLILHIIKLTGH